MILTLSDLETKELLVLIFAFVGLASVLPSHSVTKWAVDWRHPGVESGFMKDQGTEKTRERGNEGNFGMIGGIPWFLTFFAFGDGRGAKAVASAVTLYPPLFVSSHNRFVIRCLAVNI